MKTLVFISKPFFSCFSFSFPEIHELLSVSDSLNLEEIPWSLASSKYRVPCTFFFFFVNVPIPGLFCIDLALQSFIIKYGHSRNVSNFSCSLKMESCVTLCIDLDYRDI